MVDLLRYDRSDNSLESVLADMMALSRRATDLAAREALDRPVLEAHTALGQAQEFEEEADRALRRGDLPVAQQFRFQAREERRRVDRAMTEALAAFRVLERRAVREGGLQ